MRQFNEALQRPSYKDRADRSLNRLAVTLFGQGMDSEQADFVAEMIRGASPIIVGKVSCAPTHDRVVRILNRLSLRSLSTPACRE